MRGHAKRQTDGLAYGIGGTMWRPYLEATPFNDGYIGSLAQHNITQSLLHAFLLQVKVTCDVLKTW